MNIRKLICLVAATAALALSATSSQATPTNFVSSGDSFQYSTLTTDLWNHWATASLADFSLNNGTWNNGTTKFTNQGGGTYWAANTDLALQKTFNFSGIVNGALNLHVASDNGFLIFLNGQLLAKENAEGYTSYWEYNFALNSSPLLQGLNTLQVLAEDHGGATFFDMKMDADVTAVPEPSLLALFGLGLLGMLLAFRNKRHSV